MSCTKEYHLVDSVCEEVICMCEEDIEHQQIWSVLFHTIPNMSHV